MKKAIVGMVAGILILGMNVQGGFLEEGTRALRLDVILDSETFDSSNIGFEAGFGTALYALDDVGLFAQASGSQDNDRFQSLGVYIEENYPVALGLVPYAGLGIGYGWQDADRIGDTESWYGRIQGGANFVLSESVALNATLRYNYSSDALFLRDDALRTSRVDVTFGIRYYY